MSLADKWPIRLWQVNGVPTPDNPADNLKFLRANNGTYDWRNLPLDAGYIIQSVSSSTNNRINVTSTTPYDNTRPLATEGQPVTNVHITPTSASSIIRVRSSVAFLVGGPHLGRGVLHWHVDSNAAFHSKLIELICTNEVYSFQSGYAMERQFVAGTTSSINIKLRAGLIANTFVINPESGSGNLFNDTTYTTLVVEELYAP